MFKMLGASRTHAGVATIRQYSSINRSINHSINPRHLLPGIIYQSINQSRTLAGSTTTRQLNNNNQVMECGGVCVRLVLVRSLMLRTHSISCKNGWVTTHFLQHNQGLIPSLLKPRQWMEGSPLRQIPCKWLTSSTYVCK